MAAGENFAAKFKPKSAGVWELVLSKTSTELTKDKLTVSDKDKQGNVSRIEGTFSERAAHDRTVSRGRDWISFLTPIFSLHRLARSINYMLMATE